MLAVDAAGPSLYNHCRFNPLVLQQVFSVNEFTNVARVNYALGRRHASCAILTRLILAANEEIQTYERQTHVSGGACADW